MSNFRPMRRPADPSVDVVRRERSAPAPSRRPRRTAMLLAGVAVAIAIAHPAEVRAAITTVTDKSGDVRHVRWDPDLEKPVRIKDGRTRPIDIASLEANYDWYDELAITLQFHELTRAWRTATFYLDADDDRRWDYLIPAWRGPHNGVQTGSLMLRTSTGAVVVVCPTGDFEWNKEQQTMTMRFPTSCASFKNMKWGIRVKARVTTPIYVDEAETVRRESWYVDETKWTPITYGVKPRPLVLTITNNEYFLLSGVRYCQLDWEVLAPDGSAEERWFTTPVFDGSTDLQGQKIIDLDVVWGPYHPGDRIEYSWSATAGDMSSLVCNVDTAIGLIGVVK